MASESPFSPDRASITKVLRALSKLDAFPTNDFITRLFNLTREAPDVAALKDKLPIQEHRGGPHVTGAILDNAIRNRLAVEAVVSSIGQLNDSVDAAGFKTTIRKISASKGIFEDMTRITALFMAQYIDGVLESEDLPSLTGLHEIPGFAAGFTDFVTDENFVSLAVFTELSSGHRMYSTAMVFTCAYLHHGPGFAPQTSDGFANSVASRVVSTWARILLERKVKATDVFNFCNQVASVAAAPEYDENLRRAEMSVRKLVMKSIYKPVALRRGRERSGDSDEDDEEDFQGLVESASDEFQGIVTVFQLSWRAMGEIWFDTVSEMATAFTQTSRTYTTEGSGSTSSRFNPPIRPRKWHEVTTTTGRALADWLEKVKQSHPQLLHKDRYPPNVVVVNKTELPINSGGGCFRPGTIVATKEGTDILIESIQEGTILLTHADGQRLGVCSDENVTVKVSSPFLVGFNDEGVFATPDHVFHTTTGLRAVDPEAALAENSWLDVGRLQVGHILHRLSKNGKSYDLFPIKSIQVVQVPSVKTIHGVHLREGDRSYHANGFLVAVNYPEITMRSVAAALEKLPPKEQLKVLSQLTNLGPLFQKLGISGVQDLLRRELTEAKQGRLNGKRGPNVVRFREMRRSLALTEAKASLVETKQPTFAYKLPTVEIFDGVVMLDGKIESRVALDLGKSTIRWSRQLPDGTGYYEHGLLIFAADGFDATGAVLLVDDANPTEARPGKDFIISFSAEAPIPKIVQRGPARAPKPVLLRAQRSLEPLAQTGILRSVPVPDRVPGIPVNPVAEEPIEPVPEQDEVDDTEEDGEYVSPVFDPSFNITMQVDTEAWPANTERFSPLNPIQIGTMGPAVLHSSTVSEEDVRVSVVIMPELDQLLVDYNNHVNPELRLSRLYRSFVHHNPETGGSSVQVRIVAASAIASFSDQFESPEDVADTLDVVYPTRNLTFTNIGSEVTIPMLFVDAEMEVDLFWEVATGSVWEFDKDFVGYLGERHYFDGSWLSARSARSSQARLDKRAQISLAASEAGQGVAAATPSPVTSSLSRAALLANNELANLMGMQYEAEQHQLQTRAMFEKLMYYFMDKQDREDFTNRLQPEETEFSPKLLASLSISHKKWMTETYCKAFVAFSISKINKAVEDGDDSDENPGFQFKLTDEQKDKIWYFWSGNGETCLATSKEFNEINERISLYVLRDMLGGSQGDFATTYLTNGKGPYWADKMVLGAEKAIPSEAAKPVGDENILHKWCTIAHCLAPAGIEGPEPDPDEEVDFETALQDMDHATQIFTVVLAYLDDESHEENIAGAGLAMLNYPIGDWIQDSIGAIIDAVYDGTSDLDQEVRDTLLKDFNDLIQEFNIDANATVDEFKQQIFVTTAACSASMANLFALLPQIFNMGLGQSVHSLVNYVFRTTTGISVKVANSLYATLFLGVMSMVLTPILGGEQLDFAALDPTEKASFILLNTKATLDAIAGGLAQFKAMKVAKVGNAAAAAAFDEAFLPRRTTRPHRTGLYLEMTNLKEGGVNVSRTRRFYNRLMGKAADAHLGAETAKARFKRKQRHELWKTNKRARQAAWQNFDAKSPRTGMAIKYIGRVAFLVGIGASIAFSVSLFGDIKSGTLTRRGRALARAQIATFGLAAAAEGLSILLGTVPYVGFVLALVGLILGLLYGRDDARVQPDPDPSPAEIFIRDQAIPLCDSLVPAPTPALTYTLVVLPAGLGWDVGQVRRVMIVGQNTTDEDIQLSATTLSFSSGGDDGCVFSESVFENLGVLDAADEDTTVGVGEMAVERLPGNEESLVKHNVIVDDFGSHIAYQASIEPQRPVETAMVVVETEGIEIEDSLLNDDAVTVVKPNADGLIELEDAPAEPPYDEDGEPMIVIPPGGGYRWILRGTVNPIQDDGPGESWLEVTELRTDGDKTLTRFYAKRG